MSSRYDITINCNRIWTNELTKKQDNIPKIIWIIWNQEYDSMPLIVKKCINKIRQLHNNDWKINIVTPLTYHKYIRNKDILYQVRNKSLAAQHMSDLLRLYLISEYGGVYLDASIILM